MKPFVLCLLVGLLCGCDRLSSLWSDMPGSDMAQAQAAMRDGQWTRAQRFLERLLVTEEEPDQRWEAWNLLLNAAGRAEAGGNWLVDYLETMAMEYEDQPERLREVLRRLATLHENARRPERAVAVWEQYSRIQGLDDDENAMVHRRMAKLQVQLRRFDDAEDALHVCLAFAHSEKRQGECLYDMADMASTREDVKQTTTLTTQILQLEGADPIIKARAGFMLADILEMQGKTNDALKLFQEIKTAYPNELVVNYRIQALSGKKK